MQGLNAYFNKKSLTSLQVLFDIIAVARHVPKKETINVFKTSNDKINAFEQKYCLRPKGSERADLVGRKISDWTSCLDDKTCTRFFKPLTKFTCLVDKSLRPPLILIWLCC